MLAHVFFFIMERGTRGLKKMFASPISDNGVHVAANMVMRDHFDLICFVFVGLLQKPLQTRTGIMFIDK